MYLRNDTIVAIATPPGIGGISVIRISGKEAIAIADKRFRGGIRLTEAKSHTAHLGFFESHDSEQIDQVVATVFLEPNSYTGENVVEISCHGGIYLSGRILSELIRQGGKRAEPGEFTFRAFANGRIDLTQVEAVSDLIHAQSESARQASLNQLKGSLSSVVSDLKKQIVESCGLLELELDFSDEDIELVSKNELEMKLGEISALLGKLIDSFSTGKLAREGAKLVIAGPPNVGKSSIFNNLLREERAIVTDIPGTTRDKIEENIIIDGLLLRLIDTAGFRDTADLIENKGMKITDDEIADADIVIFVIDNQSGFDDNARILLEKIPDSKKVIRVINKSDLRTEPSAGLFSGYSSFIEISAKTDQNIDLLKKEVMKRLFPGDKPDFGESIMVTKRRHYERLVEASEILERGRSDIRNGLGNEIVSAQLRSAINILSEITGEITSDDILDGIFSNFCIGK